MLLKLYRNVIENLLEFYWNFIDKFCCGNDHWGQGNVHPLLCIQILDMGMLEVVVVPFRQVPLCDLRLSFFKNKRSRIFFKIFREFFANFLKCSHVFRSFRTCSDLFGPVRTCSDAFGCIWMRSEAFGRVRKISEILVRKMRFLHFWKGFDRLGPLPDLRERYWREWSHTWGPMWGLWGGGDEY